MNQLQTPPLSPSQTVSEKPTRPIVRLPQQRNWFDTIPGERVSIVVHSDDVKGRYSIFESLADPGVGTPMHYHAEDEIFRVLEGVLTFSLDGATFDAHPGTTVVVPARRPHAWRNCQTLPSLAQVTITPGGLEGLFQQLNGATPDEIACLAAEYGSYVVGPGIDD